MLHRVSKKKDGNKDKWIGVGGHFEEGESPEDCLLREVREETDNIFFPLPQDTINAPAQTAIIFNTSFFILFFC